MFLASFFIAAFARAFASPVPVTVPGTTMPSPICVVAAAMTASRCDPTRTRTIFDILYSCIGVILLCTYISMHHNIQDQNDSRAKVMWLKIRTTLYALIAPEVVIVWAIRQRIMAGRIAKENKHRRWTRTHGFFIQMGGLMQRQEDLTYEVLCNEYIVKETKIPDIPEKEIRDHGKGDILAKALVVVQTTWFVAQCIARHIQGLVLTEIELVTLAFATLNVITYGLWWDKPLNIEYPIYFDENGVRTDGPLAEVEKGEVTEEGEVKEWRGVWYQRVWGSVRSRIAGWDEAYQNAWERAKQSWSNSCEDYGLSAVVAVPFIAVFLPLWLMMADEALENRPTSVHPFYAAKIVGEDEEKLAIFYGSVIGVLFGAIHLIGWNFQFSTIIELWLWRASSLILTIVPLFLATAFALALTRQRFDANILGRIGLAFFFPTAFLGAPLYFAARIILLFLAFFSLRCLPESAYQNVKWTDYIPHI
ncbi:hypothetical protein AX16_004644 [Volvariella volvacea WC 439]|nr:hypothetical protein AX16_004644 [Volvariella volvacea WC 439]